MDTALWILAGTMVVIGIAGTVLPALPGTLLVFGGLLLAAWLEDFGRVGTWTMALLGGMTALSFVIDLAATALGAQRAGASRQAIVGAALGTLLGLPFGLAGLLLGPFAGAVAGEFIARRDPARAGKVGLATWLGFLFGTVLKLALVFTMIGVFALAYFL